MTPSSLLNNRYRLDSELGRGGMGTIYRAYDALLDRPVAVKVLSASTLGTEGRARLLGEARAAARLNHPNIVSVYDVGAPHESPFIVMELVEGESLDRRRPADLDETIAVARQVCVALAHAHQHGIVHRDLKPENVMVTTGGAVKLMDFGLARSVTSRLSTEDAVVGTVFYLAPEQALGQAIDARTDLYALGVMLYEWTTGRLPFAGEGPLAVISQHLHAPVVPPSTYNEAVPPALDRLIVRLMSKLPHERPASAEEVRQALEQLSAVRAGRKAMVELPAERSLLDRLVRGRLVGRDKEFAEAKSIWGRAISEGGMGGVLLISGEPGIGKTRFARELATLAEVSGARVLLGECYAEGGAPYAPIAQLVRQVLSDRPGKRDKLALPDLVLADLLALVPDLRYRYPDVPPNRPLDPQAERQRLFESVVGLANELSQSGQRPLMWLVEDVHWADSGTLYMLYHLARRARAMGPRLRSLVVATYREVELHQSPALGDWMLNLSRERLAERIKLGRLDLTHTHELLNTLFAEEVSADFVTSVYRETEGNPFFVEEVCKALVEEGKLYREGGQWHRAPQIEMLEIPQSVRLAIQSRVSRLPAEAQEVLCLAAVVGREFDFDTLRRASDLGEEALIDALEAAERAQLIGEVRRNGRETFAFAHALTPATLRESVSGLRRHRLHRRVASAIEAVRPDDLEALAYHYGEAGDETSALTYTVRAAERASRAYANEDAIRFYGEALALLPDDHPDRFELLAARARVLDLVARREEQLADVESMLAWAERDNDDARRCDALIALADYYLATEMGRAREPAGQAVELACKLGDPIREGHALRRVGYGARTRHLPRQSKAALEQAAARFRQADQPGEAAICLHMLSLTLSDLGEYGAALEAVEQALALSRAANDRRQEATSLRRLAIVYLHTNQHAKARPYAEQALALHRELGDRVEECNALNVMGILAAWLGRPEEAERYLRQSLDLAHEIGWTGGAWNAIDNLMWAHFQRSGTLQAGLEFLDEQVAAALQAGDEVLPALIPQPKAWLLMRLGQFELASEALQQVLASPDAILGREAQSRPLLFMARAQTELGDYERARHYLAEAQARMEDSGRPQEEALLLSFRAYLALLEGGVDNWRAGLDQVTRAIDLLGQEMPYDRADLHHLAARLYLSLAGCKGEPVEAHLAQALAHSTGAVELAHELPLSVHEYDWVHSRALRAAGRSAEADDYLRRAHNWLVAVAHQTTDETLRQSWLEKVPINREILADWAERGLAA